MSGSNVLSWISKYKVVLPKKRKISFRINLVCLTNNGFNMECINLVCKWGGCSFKIIWSCIQKCAVKYYRFTFLDKQYIPIIESSMNTEKHTRWLILYYSIASFISEYTYFGFRRLYIRPEQSFISWILLFLIFIAEPANESLWKIYKTCSKVEFYFLGTWMNFYNKVVSYTV
jgi:hypothetical protein